MALLGQHLQKKISCLSNPEVIVKEIEKMEGCFFANNPACLLFAGQREATKGRAGYARFKTLQEGHKAAVRDVAAKLRHMDYKEVVTRWTPAEVALRETRIRNIEVICGKNSTN